MEVEGEEEGRVVRSTIKAEAISLGEAMEMAVFLKEVWREILGEVLEIVWRTDSITLEMVIILNTAVSNRRLKIDLAAIKEASEDGDVRSLIWIGGREQMAACLTKIVKKEGLLLRYIMGTKRGRK